MPHHGAILHIIELLMSSQIAPLTNSQQDAASIVAEVSAAAAAQASKEFCHMCRPKIIKFKGGYSTDV